MSMPLKNKRIVAIDDTHTILTFLRISLESMGAIFQGAATAAGGVALCETLPPPDLIILDLGLPDKEGLQILSRLKRLNKEKNLPVIVLTVRKDQESIEAAAQLGADAYVTKPFLMEDLIEVIRDKLQIRPDTHLKLVKRDDDEMAVKPGVV
jgi:DNA-binding response OmpR family regulator